MTVAHAEHFDSLETQAHAAKLGTWVFLGSETLLFAGLFALYAGYRAGHPAAFAVAAGHTDLALGTLMTFVLLTASFLVAVAVQAARDGRMRQASWLLLGGAALAVGFLALKVAEYAKHIADGILPTGGPGVPDDAGGEAIFWALYYATTGLHFVHVTIGLSLLLGLAWLTRAGRLDRHRAYVVENGADYWHLVDAIWLFLWPMFYLMR